MHTSVVVACCQLQTTQCSLQSVSRATQLCIALHVLLLIRLTRTMCRCQSSEPAFGARPSQPLIVRTSAEVDHPCFLMGGIHLGPCLSGGSMTFAVSSELLSIVELRNTSRGLVPVQSRDGKSAAVRMTNRYRRGHGRSLDN